MFNANLTSLSERDLLVYNFFRVFFRFEHALKETGFVAKPRWRDAASPDWDRFVSEIEWDEVRDRDEVVLARNYFTSNPPNRQVFDDGRVVWRAMTRDTETESEVAFIVRCVKTTRNNLFHGGKAMSLPSERDGELLRHALAVLLAIVELNPDVKHHFEDEGPHNDEADTSRPS